MTRTVYLNGDWLAETEAKVSVFDRGFLFADAIYEVTAVIGGRLIDYYYARRARLQRSMAELGIPCPLDSEALLAIHREIVDRNGLREGLIYLQVSRGVADRDFAYPKEAEPTLVLFTAIQAGSGEPARGHGDHDRPRSGPALDQAGHQDGPTPASLHGEDGSGSPWRRRRVARRGRLHHRGERGHGAYRDPGRDLG